MDEKDFWKDYELIRAEVSTAMESFYTYIEIHNFGAEDKGIFRELNENPTFWKITLYGLQTSFFIVLGRIFDDSPDAHSIHKFVNSCVAHPEFFSKEALAARRCAGDKRPDWLDTFIARAFEPSTQDLRQLKKTLSLYRQKFDAVYRDIRHLVFAHNVLKDQEAISELFSKTEIKEIDDILYFMYDLLAAIWELYKNGRKPELGVQEYDYRTRIRESTRGVLSSLSQGCWKA